MDSIRRFFSRSKTPAATLGVQSEAPAHVISKRPVMGRKSRPFGANAFYKVLYNALVSGMVSNPDNLTVREYRSMLDRDDAVKWAVKYASLCIMAHWKEYENENKRVKAYVDDLFGRCETSVMDWGEEACSAKWAGYSVTELCVIEDARKLWLKELPVIDPDLEFVMDEVEGSPTFGRVKGIQQGCWGSVADTKIIAADRLMIHTNNGLFGNPYGTSDLKCSYAKFVQKELLFLQWGRTIERFGTPTAYGTSQSLEVEEQSWFNTGQTVTRADNILDALERIAEDAVGAMPEEVKLTFLEAKGSGQDFEGHQNYCTKAILRGFLISSILSEAGDVGSFAMEEGHREVFLANCASDTMSLQRSFMRQVLAPLIRWNFGPNVPLGGFAKPELSKDVKAALSSQFFSLTNAGYMSPGARDDSDFVRDKMGMKPVSDEELKAAGERHNARQQKDNSKTAGENLPPGQAPDGLRGTDPGVPNPTPQTPGRPQGRQEKRVA